jgi:hypothetical protein
MYLVGLIAIASAALILINVNTTRKRRNYVQPDKPTLHYSAVQIICGDCSGEGISPMKTFMDRHGHCEACGGASYILASERGLWLRSSMAQHGLRVVANEAPAVETAHPHLEPVPQMKIAV